MRKQTEQRGLLSSKGATFPNKKPPLGVQPGEVIRDALLKGSIGTAFSNVVKGVYQPLVLWYC